MFGRRCLLRVLVWDYPGLACLFVDFCFLYFDRFMSFTEEITDMLNFIGDNYNINLSCLISSSIGIPLKNSHK